MNILFDFCSRQVVVFSVTCINETLAVVFNTEGIRFSRMIKLDVLNCDISDADFTACLHLMELLRRSHVIHRNREKAEILLLF